MSVYDLTWIQQIALFGRVLPVYAAIFSREG